MSFPGERLASGRQGRGKTERLLLRQAWLEDSWKKPALVNGSLRPVRNIAGSSM
jgi:hypothetical protein